MVAAGDLRVLQWPRLSRWTPVLHVEPRHCRPCGKCLASTASLGVQWLSLGCCKVLGCAGQVRGSVPALTMPHSPPPKRVGLGSSGRGRRSPR